MNNLASPPTQSNDSETSSRTLTKRPSSAYRNIIIGKEDLGDEEFEALVQESISSLYVTDIAFEKIPSMTFDEACSQCNWTTIFQKEIFGPFAPRSGWIGSSKRTLGYGLQAKRRNGFLQTVACAILDKARPKSLMFKALKRQQVAKYQQELEELERIEKLKVEVANHVKAQKKFRYGQICDIFCGTKRHKARRCSEFAVELPRLLDFGNGLNAVPRCRSCNCSHCKRKKAGIEYMFDVPKPWELNRRKAAQADFQARKAQVLLAKSAAQKKGGVNRYGALMSPLIMQQSHIAELRKQHEMLKDVSQSPSPQRSTTMSMNSGLVPRIEIHESSPKNPKPQAENDANKQRQQIDLVRSPMCKRRATLKMALAEAANLHNKLSAFAAELPEKKGPPDTSSEDSTPSSNKTTRRHGVINLHPVPSGNEEPKSTPKMSTFQRISKVKQALNKFDEQIPASVTINEAECENGSPRKDSKGEKGEESTNKKKTKRKILYAEFQKHRKNQALANYISEKISKEVKAMSMTSMLTLPSSAEVLGKRNGAVSNIAYYMNSCSNIEKYNLPEIGKTHKGDIKRTLVKSQQTKRNCGKTNKPLKGAKAFKKVRLIKSSSLIKRVYGKSTGLNKVNNI